MFTLTGSFLIRFCTFAEEDYIFRFVTCLMGEWLSVTQGLILVAVQSHLWIADYFPGIFMKFYCLHFDLNLFQDLAWISGLQIFLLNCWMKIWRD